jgi:hypothetical protein
MIYRCKWCGMPHDEKVVICKMCRQCNSCGSDVPGGGQICHLCGFCKEKIDAEGEKA